jgi:hypothetical protein
MTILPLIGRQLRVRARSPAGYWTRFWAALWGIAFFLPMLFWPTSLFSPLVNPAQMGAHAFRNMVVAAFVLCCFSGVLTVDAISRERREETLGFLFLTRVRAMDVLLGNFGAAGIASLCALAALAPVLIVPVLAGGVTGGEAARKVLVLFDTMILSLAIGLWASAGGREWRSCARSAAGLLFLLIFGPLMLEALFPLYTRLHPWFPGPLRALGAAEDSWYKHSVAPYWISIAVVHVISWFLVIWAGIRLRRALREEDETPANSVRPSPGDKTLVGTDAPRTFDFFVYSFSFGRKPLAAGQAPLEWLMGRQGGVKTVVWAGALLGAAYHSGLLFSGRFVRGILGGYSAGGMGLAFSVVEGCLFAWAASRFFIEARRTGELELLLTTPEGAKTILASQWKWLENVFFWPFLVLVAPFLIRSLINEGFMLLMFSSILNTLAGLVALLWAGMWFGWSERSQARAIVRIVIVAKAAPYLVGMLGSIVVVSFVPRVNPGFLLAWFAPETVTLLFYVCLIRWARRRLAGELPQAAMGF